MQFIFYAALGMESILGMPQVYKNYVAKSTQGLRMEMIGIWFLGDLFKTVYFHIKNQPLPFKMCAVIQLIVDFIILFQMFVLYKAKL